jgi:hypothetical protein
MKNTNKKNRLLKMLGFAVMISMVMATPTFATTAGDLINTESFMIISDLDGTSDIQLQFGDIVSETLEYDRANSRFEFSSDLYVNGTFESTSDATVGGDLGVAGDADVTGNISMEGTTLTLDALDTGDIDLVFGNIANTISWDNTNSEFHISDELHVEGDLEQYGNDFTLDADNTGVGANVDIIANQGSDLDGVLRYNATTNEWEISNNGGSYSNITTGDDLGALDGTSSDTFFLDNDNSGGDVSLYFGNALAEYLTWNDTLERFELSDDLYVDGTLESTSNLTVGGTADITGLLTADAGIVSDGDIDFNQNMAVEMVLDQGTSFPVAPAPIEGQTFYRSDLDTFYIYDGSSWIAMADGTGTGNIYMAPLYSDSTYAPDGSQNVGRLTYYYDSANSENAYHWETTRPGTQDYAVVAKLQLPDNFASWGATPIEFKYRTETAGTTNNQLDFTMADTASAAATLANNTGLASTTADQWVTSTNMGITGGTWTAGNWFTVNIQLAANNAGSTDAGSIVFNYNTSN